MLNRLLNKLAPRPHPELMRQRIRLARSLTMALIFLLGLWLMVEVVFRILLPPQIDYPFLLDLLAILFLGICAAISVWLLGRQRLIAAGYLLAIAFFVFATANLVLHPEGAPFLGAVYMLPILIAGAMIGGLSPYPFMACGIVALTVIFFTLFDQHSVSSQINNPFEAYLFLISHIFLYVGAAGIVHFLSGQIASTVAQLHSHAEHLNELAKTDPLTGLANRRHLIEQLEREFDRARRYQRPLTLLYMDLDSFKSINDRHGHLFGDEVLRGSGRSMGAVLRSTDLLARIGGDEFAVLLPESGMTAARNVAKKLRKAINAYGEQLGPVVQSLSFCAGISQIHPDDVSIDDMLIRADSAQYLAKKSGRSDTYTEQDLEQASQTAR